jgi:hypothetical protein
LNSDCTSTFAARSPRFSPFEAITNGASASFSSPVICSFGFTGSFNFTSMTSAAAAENVNSTAAANAVNGIARFIGNLPEVDWWWWCWWCR